MKWRIAEMVEIHYKPSCPLPRMRLPVSQQEKNLVFMGMTAKRPRSNEIILKGTPTGIMRIQIIHDGVGSIIGVIRKRNQGSTALCPYAISQNVMMTLLARDAGAVREEEFLRDGARPINAKLILRGEILDDGVTRFEYMHNRFTMFTKRDNQGLLVTVVPDHEAAQLRLDNAVARSISVPETDNSEEETEIVTPVGRLEIEERENLEAVVMEGHETDDMNEAIEGIIIIPAVPAK